MAFTKPLPEWNNQGTEPPTSLKTSGWKAIQKPPADYFNWLQYTAYQALQELQQKAADKNEITVQDGTTTQKGVVQLEDSTSSTSTTKAATPNSVKIVNDALTTHQNDLASQVSGKGASLIGLNDAAGNFTATNVEGAMSELFTNVSNGKDLVGTAITDVDESVIVPTDPTFQDLATAIGSISTGKKWTSGISRTVNNTITVNDLTFRPSLVIVKYPSADFVNIGVYLDSSSYPLFPSNLSFVVREANNALVQNFAITDSGFSVYDNNLGSNVDYIYLAFE